MGYRLSVIGCVALIMSACSTAQLPPIDDVYFWPEKIVAEQPASEASSSVTDNPTPVTPEVEYLNVQDTTVTVRIKR